MSKPSLSAICRHDWHGTDGGDTCVCTRCHAWWCYDGNETTEEPPYAEQERGYEASSDYVWDWPKDDTVCAHGIPTPGVPCAACQLIASDPCHARQRQITAAVMQLPENLPWMADF